MCSTMTPPWLVVLVWLICSSIHPCESDKEAEPDRHKTCNASQSCMGITYDVHEAVCCRGKLHQGQGLSCCGTQPFHPASATCCQVESGSTFSANVTLGVSEAVSACCGLEAYNPVNQLCCQSVIVTKPVPMAQCCGKGGFDQERQLCCGPVDDKKVLTRMSNHHQCCQHEQFNLRTQCCCDMDGTLSIQPIQSNCCVKDSAQALQGGGLLSAILPLPSSGLTKTAPKAQQCNHAEFDADKYLCCGPINNKTIVIRKSSHHQCCGHGQYDMETECCYWIDGNPKIQPIDSIACAKESGAQGKKPYPQPSCTEPHTCLCGSTCYNTHDLQCCEGKHSTSHCTSGGCDTTPTVYNPRTQVCCDGHVSKKEPWKHQCCGQATYALGQPRVLCCNGTLHTDREDGEECSDTNIPFNPAKGTLCCSQFHGSPGQHCCGTETYLPHHEICCHGHRHPKGENSDCCGIHVYDINDVHMKCCAGTLYNLTSLGNYAQNAKCCGSVLQKPENQVCCSSMDKEVAYSKERGFKCCGQLYYNTSLWSCCAEKLSPAHQPGQAAVNDESRYLSVSNLNKNDLCKEMNVGTVESVSLHSVAFHSVLNIHPVHGTVKPLASPFFLKTPDPCNKPKLIPGTAYFFDEVHVFTGLTHDPLKLLHFIISKCRHPNWLG